MTGHRVFHRGSRGWLFVVAGIVGFSLAPPVHAQSSGKGFLFQEPRWTFALRGGFDRANAKSDIFEFVTDTLTLERSDFSGLSVSMDLAYSIKPQLDLALNVGYTGSKTPSEFRRYFEEVGNDSLPIAQTTRFIRIPLTASVKAYLTPRGQTIGSLAWIPARFSPYLGVGGGAVRYKFEQNGDFVDSESPNLDIFSDRISTDGWTPTAHGLAGFDVALSPRWGVTTEARYSWARSETSGDFENYRIDLSGLSATMGLHVRF